MVKSTAMAQKNIQTEEYTKGSSKMAKGMDTEYMFIQPDINMKGSTRMIKNTAKAETNIQTDQSSKGSIRII